MAVEGALDPSPGEQVSLIAYARERLQHVREQDGGGAPVGEIAQEMAQEKGASGGPARSCAGPGARTAGL